MGEAAPRSRALPTSGHQLLSCYNSDNSTLLLAGPRDRKNSQRKPQSKVILLRGELGDRSWGDASLLSSVQMSALSI